MKAEPSTTAGVSAVQATLPHQVFKDVRDS